MENKKTFIITVSILGALVLALVICGSMLLYSIFHRVESTPAPEVDPGTTTTGVVEPKPQVQTPETTIPTTGGKVEIKPEEMDGEYNTLVMQGFEFKIPKIIGVQFDEQIGPFLYMNDVFQMRLVVREESNDTFNAYHQDATPLTQKALAQGGALTQDCTFVTVNGIEIVYFRVVLEEDDCLVFRTKLDDEYSLAGNLVIQTDNVSEKDFLNVISQIAMGATKSDKPDTTKEEYIGASIDVTIGEVREESSLKAGDKTVTFKVADNFHLSTAGDDEPSETDECYIDDKYNIAFVGVTEGDAKEFIESHYSFGKLQTLEKNGYTIYYSVKVTKSEYLDQKVIAACDLGNGWMYFFDLDSGVEYKISDLEKFFDISVK